MEATGAVHTDQPLGVKQGEEGRQHIWGAEGGYPARAGRQGSCPTQPIAARTVLSEPRTLTVEALSCLPPQGLQAHLRVGPLQDQSPAVQVGAVTQRLEGSLGAEGQEMKLRASGDLPQTLHPVPLPPASTSSSKARFWPL